MSARSARSPTAVRGWLLVLLALAAASIAAAVAVGSVALPVHGWRDVLDGGDSPARAVVLDLRLPRALAAFAVGGCWHSRARGRRCVR